MMAPEIKTHEMDEPASLGEYCGICRRQVSRYSCPSCNLFYCSLSCFRSELHSRCSETFYRKEIEVGIKSGSARSEQDRTKMLELLKRLEDESAAGEVGLFHPSDEENEEDSLAHRFSAIDISSASTDDLLRLLNEKERDKFFAALKDPSSQLVQELLASAELKKTRQLPWWEAPSDAGQSLPSPCVPCSTKPELMIVPTDLINHASSGVSLLYNICAVLLAYTYITRHLSMSPLGSTTNDPHDQHEARKMILQSVPFLRDRKSKLLYSSLTDAVISFWSHLDPGSIDEKAVIILLKDVAEFVRPRRIIATGHVSWKEQEKSGVLATDHPSSVTIMVISDISSLFRTCPDSSVRASQSHIVMKLAFYAAHFLSTPPSRLHNLADEIQSLSKIMVTETNVDSD